MRRSALIVAVFGLSLLSGIGPTTATDQSAAVQMCAKNPQCGLSRGNGGVNIWVDLPGGGTNEVWCPDNGPCECITCGPPKRTFSQVGQFYQPSVNAPPQSLSSPASDSAPSAPPAPPAPPPDDGGGDDAPIP